MIADALHRIFRSIGDARRDAHGRCATDPQKRLLHLQAESERRGQMHYCALLLLAILGLVIAILVVLL